MAKAVAGVVVCFCTATDYAVNWRPTLTPPDSALRLQQQQDWRILENMIGILS
jgi:hypothetical protein